MILNYPIKDDAGCVGNSNERCYFYQSTRPHAVTKVGDVTYSYDANGNMTGDSSGRNISWNRFNKPTLITKGDAEIRFDYGAARERIRQIAIADKTDAANTTTTTLYLGSGYQQIKKPGGITEHHEYLNLPGAGVHYVTYDKGTPKAAATFYLHKDHLGSTDVITGLNQADQAIVIERQSYGAFGRTRKDDWANSFATAASKLTPRGYTGHEALALVGLVHMNGRIYDPEIGRFLSPDPFIQSKASVQNVNRYSYVNNNPLSYTDPSGYFSKRDFNNFFKTAVQSTIIAAFSQAGPIGTYVATLAITRGDHKAALAATISVQFTRWLHGKEFHPATRIALHGTAGGLLSRAQGGDFRDGFIGAASVEGFHQLGLAQRLGVRPGGNRAYNATVMATLGGTASVIGGGKFANGAVSAAFAQMFNHGGGSPLNFSTKEIRNFSHFLFGNGDPLAINAEEFTAILSEGIWVGGSWRSARLDSGSEGYAATISLYDSSKFDYAYGDATVIFDNKYTPVGFYDWNDYNRALHRSGSAEFATTIGRLLQNSSIGTPFITKHGVQQQWQDGRIFP